MTLSEAIKAKALQLGFDACGIAKAEPLPDDKRSLQNWLEKGYNGQMTYMANHFDKRTNPQLLLTNAQSIIVVLLNYFPATKQPTNAPQIAKYAYGKDYHFIVKNKLKELQAFINQQANNESMVFCDSAPVLERRWAERAGLGWIGKSGLLINQALGSYCFIGELITTLPLDYDTPQKERCGSCTACIDACPTNALTAYNLNANRCISYLTIEHRGEISDALKPLMGNRLFGCDACLDACPWNKKAKINQTTELQPNPALFTIDWAQFSRSTFKQLFRHSALERAGYQKLRNRLQEILEIETIAKKNSATNL